MEKKYSSEDLDIAKELGALSKVIEKMDLRLSSFKFVCPLLRKDEGQNQAPKKITEKIQGALSNGKPAYGT